MHVVSVIAHVDHGKTTLLDNILSYTKTISSISAGTLRYLDSRIDEQERGITLKLSFFQANDYVFIDTPGHMDFESLIECSSLLCDSFIFIVDVNEGITPRTLFLLNWMKHKECVLVLNKIDKMINKEMYSNIVQIIESMNVFLERDYFSWEKNNIIIASSILLYGINRKVFERIKPENTLKDAITFVFLMFSDCQESKSKKEKLLDFLSKKNIHFTNMKQLFPLSSAILESLEILKCKTIRSFDLNRIAVNSSLSINEIEDAIGICPYAIKMNDTKLFIVKLYEDLSKDSELLCMNDHESREAVVKKLFLFKNDAVEEINTPKAGSLVAIQANFPRNCLLYSKKVKNVRPVLYKTKPFYTETIAATEEMKEKIKDLSSNEPILHSKINKFDQIELFCEGKMHFEKIACDLNQSFQKITNTNHLYESPGNSSDISFQEQDFHFSIKISSNEQFSNQIQIVCDNIDDKNVQITENEMRNAISIFLGKGGCLLFEKISFAKIEVKFSGYSHRSIFQDFLKSLNKVYSDSEPIPVVSYYSIKLFVFEDLLGKCYKLLSRFQYKLTNENYDEQNSFFEIEFLIRKDLFNQFHDELKDITRGSFSLSVAQKGFIRFDDQDWTGFIELEKKKRGLIENEILVSEPEKQRTQKK